MRAIVGGGADLELGRRRDGRGGLELGPPIHPQVYKKVLYGRLLEKCNLIG